MATEIEIHPLSKPDIPAAVECIQKAFSDDPAFRWLFDDPDKYNVKRNAASLAADLLYGLNCGAPIHVAKTVITPRYRHSDTMSMDIGKEKTPGYTFNHIENDTIDPNPTPKERIVGVSIWLPPAPTLSPWTTLTQECLLTLKQLLNNIRFLGRGGLNLRRYWIWKSQQKQAHDDILWDPSGYYFCTFLAVSEEVRGRGVGKRLVEMVTRRADKEGISCYLESSKRVPNVAIYRRMGFEVVREIRCFDSHSEGDSGSGGGEGCTLYGMIRRPRLKLEFEFEIDEGSVH